MGPTGGDFRSLLFPADPTGDRLASETCPTRPNTQLGATNPTPDDPWGNPPSPVPPDVRATPGTDPYPSALFFDTPPATPLAGSVPPALLANASPAVPVADTVIWEPMTADTTPREPVGRHCREAEGAIPVERFIGAVTARPAVPGRHALDGHGILGSADGAA